MQQAKHIPVMLGEAINALAIRDNGIYVDATAGAGGHCSAILDQLGSDGRLLAIDRDPDAVAGVRDRFVEDPRIEVFHSPFSRIAEVVASQGLIGKVNGILVDLGVSSMQLDQPERGFSFMRSGDLDMRMDSDHGMTLSQWLSTVDEFLLVRVLREYGEERHARRIAAAILEQHAQQPLATTAELAELVAKAMPRHDHKKHPATRTFQALRIALNDELGELQRFLLQVISLLAEGGRLVVLSFHSLEDRIVKRFIAQHSKITDELPLDLPVIDVERLAPLTRVRMGKKPSREEVSINSRSRSVIMRVAERTTAPVAEPDLDQLFGIEELTQRVADQQRSGRAKGTSSKKSKSESKTKQRFQGLLNSQSGIQPLKLAGVS
ncbi:MAG: 16S rRNA (cytosine(1402)-N(4))-methyltransferase RsmH [Immundisolibacteraceae bacterium]|nr:16S rRNA (cytosine(1402)-N(4))-methyltransferase RsmH [Immundisolibacteraceae bacterium]